MTDLSSSTERPLRILHLASSERWTGVAEPVVSLTRYQEELGHETWLACTPGGSFERKARIQGLRVTRALRLNRRGVLSHVRDALALRRFVRQQAIDVLHVHLLNDHWLSAISLAGQRERPLLVRSFHKLEAPRTDRPHRWLFRERTDRAIATSAELKRAIAGKLGLDNGAVAVIPGAINIERFHPGADGLLLRRELGIADDAPVAGYVARMGPGRGHPWLLESLPRVYQKLPHARVLLIGRGPRKYVIRGRIAAAPHAGRTLYGGYRADDLPEAIAAFDVALFMGQGSEGSNRAILEAMASARPVIAVNAGAAPHYIEDGVNGLLVERDDREGLAAALIGLLGDLPRAAEMGRRARETVEGNFKEIQRAKKVIEVYRQTLEGR